MAFDFKKEYKDLYLPKTKPELIDVPPMSFIDLFTEQHASGNSIAPHPEGIENGGSNFAVRFRQAWFARLPTKESPCT